MIAYKNTTLIFNLLDNKTLLYDFLSDGSDNDNGSSYLNKSISHDNESATAELYRFIAYGVLLNIIGVFGIFSNTIVQIVLCRPQMRSSINCILLALVRVDTILIISSMLLFGIPEIYPSLKFTYFNKFYLQILLVVYPLATTTQTASVYLTVMVALHRFIAVCHPLRSRSWCTYGRAKMYISCIIIFSILYNIPRLWEANIVSEWSETYNTSIYSLKPSKIRQNKIYLKVYIHWCYFIFLYLIPFLSLAVLNSASYNQVRKANKARARLSRLQHRKVGSATMLICVVFVFFVCNILAMVINIIESFDIYIDPDIFDCMVTTSNLLVTINSSTNCIIYVVFGDKFKRVFLVLFCNHGLLGCSRRTASDGGTHDASFWSNEDRTKVYLHMHASLSQNVMGIIGANFVPVSDKHLGGPKSHGELTDTV